ncbi:hypothetical protein Dimus_032200 [Dionaea muscipula]
MPMFSPSQNPKDCFLDSPEPLPVDKSSQRVLCLPYGDISIDDDEVQILGEKKGQGQQRKSGRIAEDVLRKSEAYQEKETRRERKKVGENEGKERRTKKKHDVTTS